MLLFLRRRPGEDAVCVSSVEHSVADELCEELSCTECPLDTSAFGGPVPFCRQLLFKSFEVEDEARVALAGLGSLETVMFELESEIEQSFEIDFD